MTWTSLSTSPKALIDTTVLIKSLLGAGINRELLMMARTSVFFEPVISNVCLLEFVRNASMGLSTSQKLHRDPYTWEEIQLFLDYFIYPVVGDTGPVNSAFSRENAEVIERFTKVATLREVLEDLTSITNDETQTLIESQDIDERLEKFDLQDFHVWATAIETGCDYIVTDNHKHFPARIGSIQRVTPKEFKRIMV